MKFRTDTPNDLQWIGLERIQPSKDNVRLFIERESLTALRERYRAWKSDKSVILPDAPIIRYLGSTRLNAPFELLAGERRTTAATLEGIDELPCRIVEMSDEEAYRFILEHNDVAGLTTVELAFRAAEMERLGFSEEEVGKQLGGSAAYRYIEVGHLINPEWFTDIPKLCNPSIVEWYEAARFGPEHFRHCFDHWNQGLWNEKTCSKMFRRRGTDLPIDNAEKGFRVTYDMNRFVIRGQIDLDIMSPNHAEVILGELLQHVHLTRNRMIRGDQNFGPRQVFRINPDTL